MKVKQIIESGSNNILKWAIKNKADIKNDLQLQSIINNDLSYIVTFTDVNYLELFRLTQIYRDHLRIIGENIAKMPQESELANYFPGEIIIDKEDPDSKISAANLALYSISSFYDIVLQMTNDDDIIHRSAISLFLPMITRKFEIQIPITFFDFISAMTEDESKKCFTEFYPSTLDDIISEENLQGAFGMIVRLFLKSTSIIKYNKHLEDYIKYTKYFPLKKEKSDKLYKVALIGFSKYNTITRADDKLSLFQIDKESYSKCIRKLKRNNAPLEVEFAVQMPIQYMQYIENYFRLDELMVDFPSSMSTIVNDGFVFNDFIEPISESEESDDTINNFKNQITAFQTRITEANSVVLSSISEILNSKNDFDRTATFALLPSIYSTKAIFKFNVDTISKKLNTITDPIIREIFSEMINISMNVINEIKESN